MGKSESAVAVNLVEAQKAKLKNQLDEGSRALSERDLCSRIGIVIRTWRMKEDLSTRELAANLRIGRSALEDQELGIQCLTVEVLTRLCKEFGAGVTWLFYEASHTITKDPEQLYAEIDELLGEPLSKRPR